MCMDQVLLKWHFPSQGKLIKQTYKDCKILINGKEQDKQSTTKQQQLVVLHICISLLD